MRTIIIATCLLASLPCSAATSLEEGRRIVSAWDACDRHRSFNADSVYPNRIWSYSDPFYAEHCPGIEKRLDDYAHELNQQANDTHPTDDRKAVEDALKP